MDFNKLRKNFKNTYQSFLIKIPNSCNIEVDFDIMGIEGSGSTYVFRSATSKIEDYKIVCGDYANLTLESYSPEIVDPGNSYNLKISLKNNGYVEAQNVTSNLTSNDSDIIIENSTQLYGTIEPGQIVSKDYIISISPSAEEKNIILNLYINWDQGSKEINFTISISQNNLTCPIISNFDANCLYILEGPPKAKLEWHISESPEGYYIFKRKEENFCEDIKEYQKRFYYKTYYPNDLQFTEQIKDNERACYRIQDFCASDAYRGNLTEEKCVCADLRAFYSRRIEYPPWDLNSSEIYFIDDSSPQQANRELNFFSCTNRDILHNDEDSVPGGEKPLYWRKSRWRAVYNPIIVKEIIEEGNENSPNTPKNVLGTYEIQSQEDHQKSLYSWKGSIEYEVTSKIPSLGECKTIYAGLSGILRTPNASINKITGFSSSLRDEEYWGCSLCEPVSLQSIADNYKWVYLKPGDYLNYQWKVNLNNQTSFANGEFWSTEVLNGYSYPGFYKVNNRISLYKDGKNLCHSDITPDVNINIYQSPNNPLVEGPISVCRGENNIEISVPNENSYYNSIEWWECSDEYGECYINEPYCFNSNENWAYIGSSDQITILQPEMAKQKQIYVRANKNIETNRSCYGQNFYSIHYKDCLELNPWSLYLNEFFPATSNLEENLPILQEEMPIIHSNLFYGYIILKDQYKIQVEPNKNYIFRLWLKSYLDLTKDNRKIKLIIYEYDINYNLINEIQSDFYTLEIVNQIGWELQAASFSTSSNTAYILPKIAFEFFSGGVAIDDLALIKDGEDTNLLSQYDPSFEEGTYFNFFSDERFPGTSIIRTDQSEPVFPINGKYVFINNLSYGSIESGLILIDEKKINGVALEVYIRGESFSNLGSLIFEIDFLDSNGNIIENQSQSENFNSTNWQKIQKIFYPNFNFEKLKLRIGAKYLNGWVSFDDIKLYLLNNKGDISISIPIENSGFEEYDCSSSPCNLTNWQPLKNSNYPSTSIFHPAYYTKFYPLEDFQAWGPISSELSGGKFAISISNQMFGITSQEITANEYAEYELGVWVKGKLLNNLLGSGSFVLLKMESIKEDNQLFDETEYIQINSSTIFDNFKQHRFTIVAPKNGKIKIDLISPYLNGYVVYNDITFGLWNRPPVAIANDSRYIPNQEENPKVFENIENFSEIKASFANSYDPDSRYFTANAELKRNEIEGDTRYSQSSDFGIEGLSNLYLKIKDQYGTPSYLNLNQETKFPYNLTIFDLYNNKLKSSDEGKIIVEPFYALNSGFEALSSDLKNNLIYWENSDDPKFPGTGTPFNFDLISPSLGGKNSITKTNLAYGSIFSNFYPNSAATPIDFGYYKFSVLEKSYLREGEVFIKVHYYKYYDIDFELSENISEIYTITEIQNGWKEHKIEFFLDPLSEAKFLRFEIGIKNADGWAIFDDASLKHLEGMDNWIEKFGQEYDPGFEQNPSPFWNYYADRDDYPCTNTYIYPFKAIDPQSQGNLLYPWIGVSPNIGSFFGIIKSNHFLSKIFYFKSFKVSNQNNIQFMMKWNLMPFSILDETYRGKAKLWVFIWDGKPPQKSIGERASINIVDKLSFEIPINSDIANDWTQMNFYFSGSNYPSNYYFTFNIELEFFNGWIALDDFKLNGQRIPNGSFENNDDSWGYSVIGFQGTGIFKDSQNLFTTPYNLQRYLAITNLARGYITNDQQDIYPGNNYYLSFWYRGENFLSDANSKAKLKIDYYRDNQILPNSLTYELLLNTGISKFNLFQTNFSFPQEIYNETEKFQLKIGVENIAGWLQFDDIILRPENPMEIIPDPPIYTKGTTCANQYIYTDLGKENYQWFYSNQKENMSQTESQLAFSSGNYSVSYKDPENLNEILGFAKALEVYDAPIIINNDFFSCLKIFQNHIFSARAFGGEEIISWKWDFGDGDYAYGRIVSHMYTMPGIYEVKVTATTQHCTVFDVKSYCVASPNYPCQNFHCLPEYFTNEILTFEEITNFYNEGDSFLKSEIENLLVEKTTSGKVRKYNIDDIKEMKKINHELKFKNIDDIFLEFEKDGEKVTKKEFEKVKFGAEKRRQNEERE